LLVWPPEGIGLDDNGAQSARSAAVPRSGDQRRAQARIAAAGRDLSRAGQPDCPDDRDPPTTHRSTVPDTSTRVPGRCWTSDLRARIPRSATPASARDRNA
jgi:hypothetical protein